MLNKNLQLREAVAAAKLGQKGEARRMLDELIEHDPRHEEAWLWKAALSETPGEAHRCLLRVMDLNPNNRQALSALALARLREAGQRLQEGNRTSQSRAGEEFSEPGANARP